MYWITRPVLSLTLGLAALLIQSPLQAQTNAPPPRRPEDPATVEKRLLKLAKDDNAKAQLQLGLGYLTGKYGLTPHPKNALKWLRRAAEPREEGTSEKRNPRALLYLGICYDEYYRFLKIKPDKQKALEYYLLAIEHGLPEGHHYAAFTYRELKQPEKAALHFKAAAEAGNQICQIEYARILLKGIGRRANPPAAIPFLEKAAITGSVEAQLLLASCYAGKYPPIKADARKMVDHLWNAAGKSPEAMTRIGYCYEHGIGMPKSISAATKWYEKAAELGDPHAMVNLGACYARGKGVKQNDAKALELYLSAAADDNPPPLALYNVGVCYDLGKGAAAKPALAFTYIKRAADAGLPQAHYRLGLLYETGKGYNADGKPIEADPKLAFAAYSQAALSDHPAALAKVGLAYRDGRGVDKDPAKAKLLLTKAAGLGSTAAREALQANP